MPALRRIDPLPTHELAIRLFYLYDHFRREPVVDSFPDHTQVPATSHEAICLSHNNGADTGTDDHDMNIDKMKLNDESMHR